MPTLVIEGQEFEVDGNGFLQTPETWNDEVARLFATTDGTGELTDKHWAIVRFIRAYWEKQDLAPPVRRLCKEGGVTVREVFELFTLGPARGACRIAGLPKPDGCV